MGDRTLIVASPTLSPLCTSGPLPTDGQPEWLLCSDEEHRYPDYPAAPAPDCTAGHFVEDGPFPFTVAVWQEAVKPDVDQDEGDCIGDCGRRTNGWFAAGDWGPGWYCGWCEAVPDAVLLVGAVVATVEVLEPSHATGYQHREHHHLFCCQVDALGWNTPTGDVYRLDVPIPMEQPRHVPGWPAPVTVSPAEVAESFEPAPWWWEYLSLEVPA